MPVIERMLVELVSQELAENRADVGFVPTEIARRAMEFVDPNAPVLAKLISYGASRPLGTSLQIVIVQGGVLYDFEFSEGRSRMFLLSLRMIDSLLCDLSPAAEGAIQSGYIEVRAGSNMALYETLGNDSRIDTFISFFHDLRRVWEEKHG